MFQFKPSKISILPPFEFQKPNFSSKMLHLQISDSLSFYLSYSHLKSQIFISFEVTNLHLVALSHGQWWMIFQKVQFGLTLVVQFGYVQDFFLKNSFDWRPRFYQGYRGAASCSKGGLQDRINRSFHNIGIEVLLDHRRNLNKHSWDSNVMF